MNKKVFNILLQPIEAISDESDEFTDVEDHHLVYLPLADRVIFQVSEADIKRLTSVESQSKWGGDTVLYADDIGDIAVKIQAGLPKFGRKKADGRKNRREKTSKSVGMDQKNRRSILRIVENKQELVANSEELNSGSD